MRLNQQRVKLQQLMEKLQQTHFNSSSALLQGWRINLGLWDTSPELTAIIIYTDCVTRVVLLWWWRRRRRWWWWRWWWLRWASAGWSESSTAPRTAPRLSRLSPLTDDQQEPLRVNPHTELTAHWQRRENSGEMLTIKTLAALSSCEITSGAPTAAIMVVLQWRAMHCIVGLSSTSGQWVYGHFLPDSSDAPLTGYVIHMALTGCYTFCSFCCN